MMTSLRHSAAPTPRPMEMSMELGGAVSEESFRHKRRVGVVVYQHRHSGGVFHFGFQWQFVPSQVHGFAHYAVGFHNTGYGDADAENRQWR